jgi:hypothetical protein
MKNSHQIASRENKERGKPDLPNVIRPVSEQREEIFFLHSVAPGILFLNIVQRHAMLLYFSTNPSSPVAKPISVALIRRVNVFFFILLDLSSSFYFSVSFAIPKKRQEQHGGKRCASEGEERPKNTPGSND